MLDASAATVEHDPLPAGYPGQSPLETKLDPRHWHLDSSDAGRAKWIYLPAQEEAAALHRSSLTPPSPLQERDPKSGVPVQSFATRHALGLPTGAPARPNPTKDPRVAAQHAFAYFKEMQSPDGHWAGSSGGALFILPGLIISIYTTKIELPTEWKSEMARYLKNVQRHNGPKDSGWGIDTDSRSSVFGTAFNYTAMRLLGVDAEEDFMVAARGTLHALGGANAAPSWAKLWLALINCYPWEGMNVTPPEMLLLPEWTPVHMSKYWVYLRAVYVPFSLLYGKRFACPVDDVILALRQELYTQPYDSIHWPSQRNNIAPGDATVSASPVLKTMFGILSFTEASIVPCIPFVRQRSIEKAYEFIKRSDASSYLTIALTVKSLHIVCCYAMGDHEALQKQAERISDHLWIDRFGMSDSATNGNQAWNCSFITQAMYEAGIVHQPEHHGSVVKALEWLDDCQIQDDPPFMKECYRQPTKGAWPFSTKEQGYTVSDTTAEAMKSVLLLQSLEYTPKLVSQERLQWTVDLLLGMQNASGGWGSYERCRGSKWLEYLNPAETFDRVMVEYDYPECTTAALTALSLFTKTYPSYRALEIARALELAEKFILGSQRKDGSWYGSWATCFTYAGMFSIEALATMCHTYENSLPVRRAVNFLLSKRMVDGGWGESIESSKTHQYVPSEQSKVLHTCWVVIALCRIDYPDKGVVRKAVQVIMDRQELEGNWKREGPEAIFNTSCGLDNPNFLVAFPLWALGVAAKYLEE